MKKIYLPTLFIAFISFGQAKKLNETLIEKSIKWTEVASTGRNYEEAKKFLIPYIDAPTFSSRHILFIKFRE